MQERRALPVYIGTETLPSLFFLSLLLLQGSVEVDGVVALNMNDPNEDIKQSSAGSRVLCFL